MRALILITALLAASPAAGQTTGPPPRCNIVFEGLNFGPYRSLDHAPNTATGRIEVVCDPPQAVNAVRVSLSAGSSGHPLDRTMTKGSDRLHYNVHTDPGHNRVAGDGSNGTVAPVRLVRGLGRATFRLYGRILPGQRIRAGEYDDTLRVTIEF